MDDLDKLRALAEAATTGPWLWDGIELVGHQWVEDPDTFEMKLVECDCAILAVDDPDYEGARAELDYIANVSPDVILELLDLIRDLQAEF